MSASGRNNWSWLRMFIIIGACIVALIIFMPEIIYWIWGVPQTDAGTFGDQFGAANALISGLAFAGIIASLLMQQRAVQLQHQEMQDTTTTLAQQTFEQTLTQMLALFSDVRDAIRIDEQISLMEYRYENVEGQGINAFTSIRDGVTNVLRRKDAVAPTGKATKRTRKLSLSSEGPVDARMREIDAWFGTIYSNHLAQPLGHYFRLLYRILYHTRHSALLDKVADPDAVRIEYGKVVRAMLSNDELWVLFYNSCSSNGTKFRPLADYFKLFDNLPEEDLILQYDAQLVSHSLASRPNIAAPGEIWGHEQLED